MVSDQETNQLRYQYSPISPAVGREEQIVAGHQEEEEVVGAAEEEVQAMLDNVKSVAPIIGAISGALQPVKNHSSTASSMEIKLYARRWVMLIIFVLVFMTNAFQWIQFSIINNLITK